MAAIAAVEAELVRIDRDAGSRAIGKVDGEVMHRQRSCDNVMLQQSWSEQLACPAEMAKGREQLQVPVSTAVGIQATAAEQKQASSSSVEAAREARFSIAP